MVFARNRRANIAVMCGAAVAIVLIGVGIFGLLRGPAAAEKPGPQPTNGVHTAQPAPVATPRTVADTEDAERFARAIAMALFSWDTRAEGGPDAWAQPLTDASVPDEANGVAADVRGYIPGHKVWDELRAYGTRQRLTVESITVPDAWATVRSQAAPSEVSESAHAFTVTGIAKRIGTWNSEPVESARSVSFTVFVDCPNSEPCQLLRLSRPDAPLQ